MSLMADSKGITYKTYETYNGHIMGRTINLGSQRSKIWGETSTEMVRSLLSRSVAHHAHLDHS